MQNEVTAIDDFSMIGLFLRADIVVKLVLFTLLFASIWSWAIIVDKYFRIKKLHDGADKFEDSFWSGGSLEDLYDEVGDQPSDPMTLLFSSANNFLSTCPDESSVSKNACLEIKSSIFFIGTIIIYL